MSCARFSMGLAVVAALTVAGVAGRTAAAQTPVQLRGEVFIAGKTPVEPPPGEPKNSHVYMTVTGPAALQIYRRMAARPEKNLCEEGKTLKRTGALSCSVGPGGRDAACDFAIDMIDGRLDNGRPC